MMRLRIYRARTIAAPARGFPRRGVDALADIIENVDNALQELKDHCG